MRRVWETRVVPCEDRHEHHNGRPDISGGHLRVAGEVLGAAVHELGLLTEVGWSLVLHQRHLHVHRVCH